MKYGKLLTFLAGAAVGAGALLFVNSKAGKNLAVAVASKGLELRERAAAAAELLKERADDVVAEAKCLNERKKTEK
ncbi:MAG: hypothetical protein LBS75_05425 [Synergistaceae bacterium]|jgi:hypothetical protein|nr:hypothetical protein [Synergistaceae bacterium]